MISISILSISLIGIIGLISFSLWEKKRGRKVGESYRERLDTAIRGSADIVVKNIPTIDAHLFQRMYHYSIHLFALMVLRLVKVIEKKVVKVLDTVRGKRDLPKSNTQSAFLKRVSDHKQDLEKRPENPVE
jgi:hypothetical protein